MIRPNVHINHMGEHRAYFGNPLKLEDTSQDIYPDVTNLAYNSMILL